MRSKIIPLALAALLLGGPGTATAADDKPADSTAATYVDDMTETMKAWADKVGDWTSRQVDAASDATAKAGERTEEALDDAWSAVKQDWQKLKEASADGYDAAQDKFEESLDALERTWEERDEPTPAEPGKS